MTDPSVPLDDLEEDDQERAWLDGVLFTGRAVEVYDNGVTASTTAYLNGLEHGLQRIWRRDGSLESECTLVRGQAVGRTYSWHPSGAVAEEKTFDDRGRPLWWRSWDDEGRVVGEGDWDDVYGPRAGGAASAAGR